MEYPTFSLLNSIWEKGNSAGDSEEETMGIRQGNILKCSFLFNCQPVLGFLLWEKQPGIP